MSDITAVLLWPGRMTWVGPETVTSLIETHGVEPGAMLRPGWQGETGWPVLLPLAALDHLRAHSEWDPWHGLKMQYIDPTSGGPAIPTISTFLQLLPQGFATRPYRATASSVVTVVRGRGRATIGRGAGAATFEYGPKDLWAVPSWQHVSIGAVEESVLFCASDEATHRKLGVWREQRG